MIRAIAIGRTAHVALGRSGGSARVLAALSESTYLTAGGEIVWLGRACSTLHPRAILTAAPVVAGDAILIAAGDLAPWEPPPLALDPASARALAGGGRALVAAIREVGAPDGFGALLVGARPPFPLDGALAPARSLGRACRADDAAGAAAAAVPLLGLGAGLTPSGDDYVGGVFFARALLARAGVSDADAWARAGAEVLEEARSRTHPISAALLGDHLAGLGHAPLHDLARALASQAPFAATLDAARRLVGLGHSSGWDILAGVVAGILGDEPGA